MESGLSPELQNLISGFLGLALDEGNDRCFIDLGYAISRVKQNDPPWQAAWSIGTYAALLNLLPRHAGAEALRQDLLGSALEPLEALHDGSLPPDDGTALDSAQARMLCHVRFALGFLKLAKGDMDSAVHLLHEVAATKVNVRGTAIVSGPGIIEVTPDVRIVKWLVAVCRQDIYREPKDAKETRLLLNDCKEALFLASEALGCSYPYFRTHLAEYAVKALDRWAELCERTDARWDDDIPVDDWLDLFAAAANLLADSPETDSSGSSPKDCTVESAQFMAWKFGNLVGRFVLSILRQYDRVFGEPIDYYFHMLGQPDMEEWKQEAYWPLVAALALGAEYEPHRDWHQARGSYMRMWMITCNSAGAPINEVGPESDLFWSARIGFADRILQAGEGHTRVTVVQSEPALQGDGVREMLSALFLHVLKTERGVESLIERKHGQTVQLLPPDIMSNSAEPTEQAESALTEKHFIIRYGDTGHSYESIVGPYLTGAHSIEIEDPYIRSPHQIQNFVRLCEAVIKHSAIRHIRLTTSYDDKKALVGIRDKLNDLKQSLHEIDVMLEVGFNPNMHDREIRISNGWVIKIGRGLDFFQKPNSWFELGANDFSLRKCLETKVDIFMVNETSPR